MKLYRCDRTHKYEDIDIQAVCKYRYYSTSGPNLTLGMKLLMCKLSNMLIIQHQFGIKHQVMYI